VSHSPVLQERRPVVAADPSAAWVAEGAATPATDADLDEVIVTPSKVAGLTVISRGPGRAGLTSRR
jgi:hypothetical protein